jgi:hypothetical protein
VLACVFVANRKFVVVRRGFDLHPRDGNSEVVQLGRTPVRLFQNDRQNRVPAAPRRHRLIRVLTARKDDPNALEFVCVAPLAQSVPRGGIGFCSEVNFEIAAIVAHVVDRTKQ